MPVIKAEFGFFQMQVKFMFCYAMKLYQTVFRITPKRLNTVNVLRSMSKLILPVIHTKMLCKPYINQTMITAPSVSIDDALNGDMSAYNLF